MPENGKLFSEGIINPNESIHLNIYADEIKQQNIDDPAYKDGRESWMYLGILIVPVNKEEVLLSNLLNRRCGNKESGKKNWNNCSNRSSCEYHQKNNTEIHYKKCNKGGRYHIAKKWLEFLLQDKTLTYFYILGLNLSNLDFSFFGNENPKKDKINMVYNRFFRMCLLKPLKYFFHQYSSIVIDNIYYDRELSLQDHPYFPWHSIFKIEKTDSKISFNCDKIIFLDSDHRISNQSRSNLIQYLDLIMGTCMNCLHWISKDEDKEKLSLQILPLFKRLSESPNNIKSSYNYVGRLKVEFFPRRTIKREDLEQLGLDTSNFKNVDSFYTKRELRIERKQSFGLFS